MKRGFVKKILGIKIVKTPNLCKKYILGIPFIRIVYKKSKLKIYCLGVCICRVPYCNIENGPKNVYINNSSNSFEQSLVNYESLKEYIIKENHKGRTAVLGVMPPETSGIALFNALLFGNSSKFDIFTKLQNVENLFYIYNFLGYSIENNVYFSEIYQKLNLSERYEKKIFVLGNSYHNIPYLKLAILEKDKKNSYLHIHEANLLSLLFNFWGKRVPDLKYWLKRCYPEKYENIKDADTWEKIANQAKIFSIYGTRILREITGIDNFIVNNDVCQNILNEEFNDNPVNVIKAFLPIPDLRYVQPYDNLSDEYIYVGTWGIPGNAKCTKTIIDAVNLINTQYKLNLKVIIGGYDAKKYCTYELNDRDKKDIICFDSPTDEELYSLMKRADINIQLRSMPHGESSGSITQLLGMNKTIIINENFVDKDIAKYCTVLSQPVTVHALAQAIMENLHNSNCNYDSLLNRYSINELQKLLSSI